MYIPIPISDSYREYLNHDAKAWVLAYFNHLNGGYLAVELERIAQGQASKQEQLIFEKEYCMCMMLAQCGYRVEYIKMEEGCFDIYLNGLRADLKKTASHNNIENYAKKAIHKQGAELVVFEFETMTSQIMGELNKLKKRGIAVKYFITSEQAVIDL